MRKKGNNQTIKSKTRGTTEPPANKSGLMRQLADQIKTAFFVGLLCLWLATLTPEVNVPTARAPWWHFVILLVFLLLLWFFFWRKRVRNRLPWWVLPCSMVVSVSGMYVVSGISIPAGFFIGFGGALLAWVFLLILALFLIKTWWGAEGKLGKAITGGVKQGNYVYWMLSLTEVAAGVIVGWSRLWNAGERGLWMYGLLCVGVLVVVVVGWVPPWASHSEDE